jgi:hypothetical protein
LIEQAAQRQQHLTTDGRHLRKVHPTTNRAIQHPLRDFQAGRACFLIESAPNERLPPLVKCLSDGNHATRPRMPWIIDLPKFDIMGIALLSCTMVSDDISR